MTPKTSKIFTITMAMAALLLAIWAFQERNWKNTAREFLDREKLRAENLLAEKLTVEGERDRSLRLVTDEKKKNERMAAEMQRISDELSAVNAALKDVKAKKGASDKRYAELLKEKEHLEQQLRDQTAEWTASKKAIEELRAELASARKSNEDLQNQLTMARLVRYDKPLIKATRGSNNKLVVKASRAQKITTTVTLSADANNLRFAVINPAGTVLTEKDGTISGRVLSTNGDSQLIEISFSPKKKLQPGLYQIEVVSGETHIASLQVGLR